MRIQFTSFPSDTNWVKGLVDNGDYWFQAKLFDETSQYGIDGGRVSKLYICYGDEWKERNCFASYDRGWDIQPETSEEFRVYEEILEFLEAAPRRF